jgi:secreted PhoX family phosphatase
MNKPRDLPVTNIDPDDIGHNDSTNEHFSAILETRISRRGLLRGGAASAAGALFGSLGLSACGGGGSNNDSAPTEKLLAFTPVAKNLLDVVTVPTGYTASVLYALGDPLTGTTTAFQNDGTDADFENRAGDHHDGMEWFGLASNDTPSLTSTDRGLLAMNHEATSNSSTLTSYFLHTNGGTNSLPRPKGEVDKEMKVHGVSIVEVRKTGSTWANKKDSTFNRRITPLTPTVLAGVASGNSLMVTQFSNTGTNARGTINNCGTGKTPWGTLLTGEENWNGYFKRGADGNRTDKSTVALTRYGIGLNKTSRHGWETGDTTDEYTRWILDQSAGAATTDFRNEMNTFGYIVEIDAYDNTKSIRKRTSMGRFNHESAAFSNPVAGQPLAVYMGDDAQNEYIYKWVSTAVWDAADANAADRMSIGDKYLNAGKLYAAKFNASGAGSWLELTFTDPAISGYASYAFADQGDVAINARLASDAVIATPMDRPEWCAVNPSNGEVYFTLTNNSNRRAVPTGTQKAPDPANPRAYTDLKGATTQQGNVNGHIVRIREGVAGAAATTFTWDVYLFGAQSDADPTNVNISGLTTDQDFSSPDGIAFSKSTGICWIQTDDGAYTDVTNCMMLAALPGQVGDGTAATVTNSGIATTTVVGAKPNASNLKRFLVGPSDCEITGLCETPDGKAIFVNIQHPGESTALSNFTPTVTPAGFKSHWPGSIGYGLGGASARPRSATIVITKNDGGRVGS